MRAVVVRPGEGHRVGNVEFLARSSDAPRFNLAVIEIQPHRTGPPRHAHADEDDSFYILDGELTFEVEGEEVVAAPGTFVLVPPGLQHTFRNDGDSVVRMGQRPRAGRLRPAPRVGLTAAASPPRPGRYANVTRVAGGEGGQPRHGRQLPARAHVEPKHPSFLPVERCGDELLQRSAFE